MPALLQSTKKMSRASPYPLTTIPSNTTSAQESMMERHQRIKALNQQASASRAATARANASSSSRGGVSRLDSIVLANITTPTTVDASSVLRRDLTTRGGWAGENDDFRVDRNEITLLNSDGDPRRIPSRSERTRQEDADGDFAYYFPADPESARYESWLRDIGGLLAVHVLRKHPSPGTGPAWTLSDFPEGYTLWFDKAGNRDNEANARYDAYLFGAPAPRKSKPFKFRSPQEFAPHAMWLMNGRRTECWCRYCTHSTDQGAITNRLYGEAGREEKGGKGEGEKKQTTKKRTYKPADKPIMAKDYRVFS